jgi:hypothetical protein
VLFAHDQGVASGGLRNIENREDIVILIDFDRGDFPSDDFAEDIVFHLFSPL